MTLHEKFVSGDAHYSPLTFPGVGTLHSGVRSEGSITLPHDSDFAMLRNALLRTQRVVVPCMSKLKAYGTIEAFANGKTCSELVS